MDHEHPDEHEMPSWEWPWHRLARIEASLDRLHHQMRDGFHRQELIIVAATQADIDAITNKLNDLKAALQADDANIQQEISRLQAQGVDVTALQNALSDLSNQVDATSALVPAPADQGGDTPPADGGDVPPADQGGSEVTPGDTSDNGGDVPPAA